jgi:hypothetical protein
MTRFVGLDVSQKLTAICIVDETGVGARFVQNCTLSSSG